MGAEYNQSTQTLISYQQEELVRKSTGEVIMCDNIIKRSYGSKQFWKCYLMDFLCVLGIIDSRQVDIFIYIVENTQPQTNMFIGTYRQIAKEIGVSMGTIAAILKKLQKNNFIKRKQNGVWYVNPNILMKGGERKRQILLSYYENSEPCDVISVERKITKPLSPGEYQDNPGEEQQKLFVTPKED